MGPYRAQAGALKAKVLDEVLSNVGENEQQTAVEGGYEKLSNGTLTKRGLFLESTSELENDSVQKLN